MAEFTGQIVKFFPEKRDIRVDMFLFRLSEELYKNVEQHFEVGDWVKVEYRKGKAIAVVRASGLERKKE